MLAPALKELITRLDSAEHGPQSRTSASVVEINQAVSAAATLYEKIRYLVDYREEHTVQLSALERILKRVILLEGKTGASRDILQELVEGKYLEASSATEEIAYAIDRVLARYHTLLESEGERMQNFLIGLAAGEVEACLAPRVHTQNTLVAEALYKALHGKIVARGAPEDIDVQLLCASYRALYRSDDAMIRYVLWQVYVPAWNEGNAVLADVREKLPEIFSTIQRHTKSDLQWQIVRRIRDESIYYRIVRQVIEDKGWQARDVLSDPEELETYVREFLDKIYRREHLRAQMSGIRAAVYLFITKIIVGVSIEVPYDVIVLGGIHYVPLTINALFHPFLLYVFTRRVVNWGDENTDAVLLGMKKMFYEQSTRTIHVASRYTSLLPFFLMLYAVLVVLVFSAIISALATLQFNIVSTVLFLIFLAFVSYFIFRIRYNASRWRVSGSDTTLSLLAHVLANPIIRLGEWLSRMFTSLNIFVLILDFLIETPFKRVLRFFREFIFFLRERVDEVH